MRNPQFWKVNYGRSLWKVEKVERQNCNPQLQKEGVPVDCGKGDCTNIIAEVQLQKDSLGKDKCGKVIVEGNNGKIVCGKINVERSLWKGNCESEKYSLRKDKCRKVVVEG